LSEGTACFGSRALCRLPELGEAVGCRVDRDVGIEERTLSPVARFLSRIAELVYISRSLVNRTPKAVERPRTGVRQLVHLALERRSELRHLALERLPELA
jgi:hypothetical protein